MQFGNLIQGGQGKAQLTLKCPTATESFLKTKVYTLKKKNALLIPGWEKILEREEARK